VARVERDDVTRFQYRRKLRTLHSEQDMIRQKSRVELRDAPADKLQEVQAQWSHEFYMVQEEIDECQSDWVRQRAEYFDLSLPTVEATQFWERLNLTGDRLILTALGREEVRKKIKIEEKHSREALILYVSFIATIGSILVALLAIYFRK